MKPADSSNGTAQMALAWLVDHLEPSEDSGLRIRDGRTTWGTVKFYEYLLAGNLLERLTQHVSHVEAEIFVQKGLRLLLEQDKSDQTVDELVRYINDTFLHSHGVDKYLITGFLPQRFEAAPHTIQVNGVTLSKVDAYKWVSKYQELDNVRLEMGQSTNGTRWHSSQAFFATTCYQYEVVVSSVRKMVGPLISELCEPLNYLQSVLNFVSAHGFEPTRFSNQLLVPHSPVLPSPLYFIENREKSTVQFLFNPLTLTVGSLLYPVSDAVWDRVNRILTQMAGTANSGSIIQFIWTLLGIHQKALDSVDEAVAFLHYWQVVERTASPIQHSRGLENGKIVSRLAALIDLTSSEKEMLRHLSAIRNEFAHVGTYPYDSSRRPVHAIKPFADACISCLIYHWADKLPTTHDLDAYLDLAVQSPTKRRAVRIALNVLDQSQESIT